MLKSYPVLCLPSQSEFKTLDWTKVLLGIFSCQALQGATSFPFQFDRGVLATALKSLKHDVDYLAAKQDSLDIFRCHPIYPHPVNGSLAVDRVIDLLTLCRQINLAGARLDFNFGKTTAQKNLEKLPADETFYQSLTLKFNDHYRSALASLVT